MKLKVLPQTLSVCKLSFSAAIPSWATQGDFFSITKTSDELSIVCEQHRVPLDTPSERDWRALAIVGPLDFALTGILLSLAKPLAKANISIFAVSTFDTDYILVKEGELTTSRRVLMDEGFHFVD